MFDLEQAIADWRKQMPAAGIQTSVLLEELESHLRDDIDRQIQSGLNPQKAFAIAVEQLGGANILKNEFVKAGIPVREVLRRFILTLAGLPNHQLAPNMNTNVLDTEPRWATYAKAGTFLFPAVFLWLFTVVFVLPKVNEICQAAGTMIFNFS
ncbi:MAG TPA: permease prefix domain 1-containing protein, partial [Candidatus Binatia bacterium]|nr:permease prefix domain 1-containing protein [Candidatus Binatia bacterium]